MVVMVYLNDESGIDWDDIGNIYYDLSLSLIVVCMYVLLWIECY